MFHNMKKLTHCLIEKQLKDCVIKTIQPILLGIIVRYFTETNCDSDHFLTTCLTAAGLCLSTFIVINCQHPAYISVNRISMRAKIAWSSLIYKKVNRYKPFHY
jgi:hypothetical protein